MAREISSISRVGKTEPFELQVSRGHVAYHTPLFKFGSNADIDSANETIWDQGGIYSYPASAAKVYVSSSNANDTAAGTGARTVVVMGLDGDYDEISETVSLNGQTQVETDALFLRVFRAYVDTAGSGGTAAGDIYVATTGESSGVPTGTVYAKIRVGENQTLMAIYTVPAGKTLYVTKGSISSGTETSNKFIIGRFVARFFGGVFRTQAKVTLADGFVDFDWEYPLRIPEKTDLEARAQGSGNDSHQVAASFEGVLVLNGSELE